MTGRRPRSGARLGRAGLLLMMALWAALGLAASPAGAATSYTISDDATCNAFNAAIGAAADTTPRR